MKHVLLITLAVLTLISCTPSSEELKSKIAEVEKSIEQKTDAKERIETTVQLLSVYQDFIKYYPEDLTAHEVTFKAGNIAMDINERAIAIEMFQKFLELEEDPTKISQVMFYIGFIYENQVFDIETAEHYYNELISKYPESKYAQHAKTALQDLGKFPEELIEKFNNRDSTQLDSTSITDSIL